VIDLDHLPSFLPAFGFEGRQSRVEQRAWALQSEQLRWMDVGLPMTSHASNDDPHQERGIISNSQERSED